MVISGVARRPAEALYHCVICAVNERERIDTALIFYALGILPARID